MTRIPRRTALTVAGSALGTALLSTTSLPVLGQSEDGGETDPTSWPMRRGGPARTGRNEAADVGPAAETRFRTEESTNPSEPAEVAVADGRVFVTEELDDVSRRSRVVAYDATTGEQQWEYRPPSRGGDDPDRGVGQVHSAPAVADGRVYVASEGANNDGEWNYGGLHAFDAETGEMLWRRDGGARDLVLADDTLVAKDLTNNTVEAFETASGETRWSLGLDLTIAAVLGVHDDTVVAHLDGPGSPDDVAGFSLADGSRQWYHQLPPDVDDHTRGGAVPDAALADDTIYYATQTDDENALVAQSLADGSVRWNRTLTASCGDPLPRMSAPVVLDGSVCAFVSADPDDDTEPAAFLVAVDAETGEREWTWSSPEPLFGSPTATEGQVYVGTDAPLTDAADDRYYDVAPVDAYPTVAAVDAADGSTAWAYAAPPPERASDESVAMTPVPTGDGLYVKLTGEDRDSKTTVLSLAPTEDAIGPNHRPKGL
jgi:outer membrane protein assembly factor BamB